MPLKKRRLAEAEREIVELEHRIGSGSAPCQHLTVILLLCDVVHRKTVSQITVIPEEQGYN